MNINKSYLIFARVVLVLIFVVILAGSVVRTTHSGMGCPDWPRCFGRWIPPMNAGQLPPDYEKYLQRQDIDHSFNAFHTWIEYINRLAGALLGIASLIMVVWSFKKFYRNKSNIAWLSLLLLVGILAEAVIGAMVVKYNLHINTVTIHMFPIFIIAGVQVLIIHRVKGNYKIQDIPLKQISTIAIIVALVQIFIGTQVRSYVDISAKALNYTQRENWLFSIGYILTAHEIFAWITALFCVFLFWKSLAYPRLQKMGFLLLICVLAELAVGFSLVKLGFPALAQPMHLLIGSIIAVTLYAYRLHLGTRK